MRQRTGRFLDDDGKLEEEVSYLRLAFSSSTSLLCTAGPEVETGKIQFVLIMRTQFSEVNITSMIKHGLSQ